MELFMVSLLTLRLQDLYLISMSFKIEVRKKENLGKLDPEDERTDEAIWTIYPDYSGYEFELIFSYFSINLDFRGDLYSIYGDVVKMLTKIRAGEKKFSWSFLSSTFTAKGEISVTEDQILFAPRWIVVAMKDRNGNIVEAADYRSYEHVHELDKNYFLNEWDQMLLGVARDLKKVGYENLEDFDYLSDLLKKYGE